MGTDDIFRARLDQMIDLRHPLAVLASRMPWGQIESALAPAFSRKNRAGQKMSGTDLFGTTLEIAGAGVIDLRFHRFECSTVTGAKLIAAVAQ